MTNTIFTKCAAAAGVLAAAVTLTSAFPRAQATGSAASAQRSTPVRLSSADAARLAKEARAKASVTVPEGIDVSVWAPEGLVTDPIAIDVDPQGNVYVTSSSRTNLPLDIRGHANWVPLVHTLKTVEDLRAFYEKELSPANSARNGWIPDLNKDGSRDIRDFKELKERIERVQDTDGDGIADFSQVMAEGFNDDPTWDVAGGLLYHEGALFFGMPPGVYRLRDTNGDGTLDERRTISEGYNTHPAFGGHGISGVIIGPDGRLYWEVGDMGMSVVDGSGRRHSYPNQGAVLRSELDGSGFEVFATGIRNLQEFSFDAHGNLISVDNDGDHQGENERVVYIPYGSDSGWRSNWQYGKYTDAKNNRYNVWMAEGVFKTRHPGQPTHIIPPIAPWHAGPSGMVYNPGTALSPEWNEHFFVSSFPGSAQGARVYGFKLKEDGAGFAMDGEREIVRGILTVGMKFGPEGALYLTDWISGWEAKNRGRVWKLDAPAAAGTPQRKDVQSLLAGDFAGRSARDVAALLGHVDMRVRQKAQFDLVRRGDAQLLGAAARDGSGGLARLHGIWGLAQMARREARHAEALVPLLGDADAEVRAQAAKMIGDVRYAAAAGKLMPLLEDGAARPRFFAAEALGRIAHKPAADALVKLLADNDDRDGYLRHAASLALAQIGDRAALAALSSHASKAVRLGAVIALRRLRDPGAGRFMADADAEVVTEAARAINDDGGIEGALPALAAALGDKRFTGEPLLRRAISANLRLGTTEAVSRLAAFAADTARLEPLRVDAVASLGVWQSPSTMDRVDGIFLGAPAQQRDSAAARAAIERLLSGTATGTGSTEMRVALADAAGRLEIASAAPQLLAQLKGDPSPEVRVASLRALQSLKTANMDELMKVALADKDPTVRRAALGILPGLGMSEAAKVQHVASLVKSGSIVEQQGAIQVLGSMKSAEARRLLGTYASDLIAGTMAPELQADVLEAAQASGDSKIEAQIEQYQKSRNAPTVADAFKTAMLRGGDARRGVQVAMQNPASECARCHALGGQGADVGPDLKGVGARLTREQILESLLEPNARIAPGYGTVGLTLRDGQRIDGTLRQETETEVVLAVGTPPVERRIPKSEIAQRTNPVSAMPPFGLILKPREIRDLVEFLSTLK